MKLSKPHGIYCSDEKWEMIRRRARKAKMPISRFGVLCCSRAAENGPVPSLEPAGQPLVLTGERQRRLYADLQTISCSDRFVVRAPGGGEATVQLREAVRFWRLAKQTADA